jgi:hypothetical protein
VCFGGLIVAAAVVFLGAAAYMRSLERRALAAPAIRDQLTAAGTPRPVAEVSQALRQTKLVTVEVDTKVASHTGGESWRGDVSARVEAPVRLYYGTDLSKLEPEHLSLSPVGGGYLVRIPVPERIATEVCGDAESVEVEVGWMRLRSRAGEYFLGLARRDLTRRARELTLTPADARMVRRATREQAEALVKKIVGPNTPVTVAFQDGEP